MGQTKGPGAEGDPSVLDAILRDITTVFETIEDQFELRVSAGREALVRDEVLLGDVGDVGRVIRFGEDVIIGLVLVGSDLGGNRQPPLLGVIEERIDIEDHAPKGAEAMYHDVSDSEFRFSQHSLAEDVARIRRVTESFGSVVIRSIADTLTAGFAVDIALPFTTGIG